MVGSPNNTMKIWIIRQFFFVKKKEYENIILNYYHELPKVAPVFFYRTCLELLKDPNIRCSEASISRVEKRNRISKIVFDNIPSELKAAIYFQDFIKIVLI